MRILRSKPLPPLTERAEQLISKLVERVELIFPVLHVLDGPTCVICLEVVAPGDPARQLSCSHAFHAKCIDPWWRRSLQKTSHFQVSCPTCRREFEVCSSSALSPPQVNNTRAATIPPQEEVESMDVV
ncbi:unnamed protein product [Polarella glacialis]|uniref:RING-type domain-containing protein n=1 Tax=Polarella glacialis TaxID=89957 RepID=A0A813FUX6_POLGL|nr:unnamed protein product [Polarella glacialis]